MKQTISTTHKKCHVTTDNAEMSAILYNMLYARGLITKDAGEEAHPNFAMTSPTMRRLIENTAHDFVKRLNVSVEFE